ncbi:MAG: acetyl-CoA decarbonylase/synthase complex subunit alpha/beta [Chloroflexota bacterium]|nr:acetyl-CoA decarbonylase/synthase complex subunit alpha/beta [Chloroflexota bacterium]
MSRLVATLAISGAHKIVTRAGEMLESALEKHGPDTPVAFVDRDGAGTTYGLPVIYALTGKKISKLGDIPEILEAARGMLTPVPDGDSVQPDLGNALNAGVAAVFAEELIKGIEFVEGKQPEVRNGYKYNGPISDVQTRSWGVAMVGGSMSGFAVIVGAAKSNEVAVKIVRELQSRGQLVFLSSTSDGRSIVDQLLEEGIELGYNTYTVPLGSDTESAIYAAGYAARAAISFGNIPAGNTQDIIDFNKKHCMAYVLCLGPLDDVKVATGAGALNLGFPIICDTEVPDLEGVEDVIISMPFDDIPGEDDMERARKLVQRCIETRGIKLKITEMPIPVSFGPAFEGEIVRRADMQAEWGGKNAVSLEWLRMKGMDEIEDGKFTVVGPEVLDIEEGSANPIAVIVEVAGSKMEKDFEPVLERQIHNFVNCAEGVQHIGQRDSVWIRISKSAVSRGFQLKHLGDILHASLHNDFGAIVDKVQVTIYTDKAKVGEFTEQAREVYRERDERMAGITDEAVDTYYSCTLCQSFAPNHVCIIPPERTGLCGAYSWLDCRAAYEINPTGPNQPVIKGTIIDADKGEWEGVNQFVHERSNRIFDRFTFYSIMDAPMTTCGCCEAVTMLIPEANGVLVVSRDDPSITPAGMTFTTMMGTVGGGQQTPGMMGHSKRWLASPKYIPFEGGLKRVVWLSKNIKEEFADELKAACARLGEPDLLDKIADGDSATTIEELLPFLEEKGHPALTMAPII